MIDSGINEVKEIIQFYHQQKQNQVLLEQLFNPETLMKENYTHSSQKLNIAFYIILEYCIKIKSSENQILDEIFKLIPNKQELLSVEIKNRQLSTAFQKLVFAYTTQFIYRQLNNKFARFEYLSIQHSIKCLYEGFKSTICCKNVQLHRGLSFTKEQEQDFNQICTSLTQGLDQDKTFYWNSLVSTSLNFEIQSRQSIFQDGYSKILEGGFGISFQIFLTDYPAFIIPKNFTEFPNEQEVVIFPQFPFKVMKLNLSEKNFLEVTVRQVKKAVDFSLDDVMREKYWRKVFEGKIIRKLYNTIDSHFFRVQYILDRYFLFKKKEIEAMGKKYLHNEMKRSIENIEVTLQKITRTISNEKIKKSFITFFKSLKSEINLSNDYGEIKLQLQLIQNLILEKTVQIIQFQVFNLEEVKHSLKNLKKKKGILKRIPYIAFPLDYLREKAVTYYAAIQAMDMAQQKIKDVNILGTIQNLSSQFKEFLNELILAKYYFTEFTNLLHKYNLIPHEVKIMWDNSFKINYQIPQIFQTSLAVAGFLVSIIAEITLEGFSLDRITNAVMQLAVTSLPYIKYAQTVKDFLSGNPIANAIFNWSSTIFVSALQLTPVLLDQNLSAKEKGFQCTVFALNIGLNMGCSYFCTTAGNLLGGPLGLFVGGIVGGYLGNIIHKKLDCITSLSAKIKIDEKNFKQEEQPDLVPYMKIEGIQSEINNIIVIGVKGLEYNEFFCLIIRKVYSYKIDIVIPEGANRQDKDNCFYLAPELQNKGKLKFIVYGVAESEINKQLLKDWLLKHKQLQIIDQCEINA